jgi:hypothetical protein
MKTDIRAIEGRITVAQKKKKKKKKPEITHTEGGNYCQYQRRIF